MIELYFWRLIDWIAGICEHDWIEYQDNSMKRRCLKCERIEWLFGNPYPAAGEPAYQWKKMQ